MSENVKFSCFTALRQFVFLRRTHRPLLAFLMFLGLFFGSFISIDSNNVLFSLMRMVSGNRVSIVGLITILMLPFLLSAFAVFLSSPVLLFPICFVKVFSFAFTARMLMQAFGEAGWLARWLLLFSSGISLPVLIWFCMRHIDGIGREHLLKDFVICAVLVLLIGSLDYRVISPFLVKLIE